MAVFLSEIACRLKGLSISIKNIFSFILNLFKKIKFKEINTRIHLWQRAIANFIKRHRTIKLLHLFRNYSAFAVVVSSSLLVSATNAASGKGTGNLLFGYWDGSGGASNVVSNKIKGQVNKKNDLALVPLSKSNTAVEPGAIEEIPSQNIIAAQGIISATGGASPMKDPEEDGGVAMYIVQSGDTLSSIAEKNKVSINTILWANDISNIDSIMPGDTLFILPVSGIKYIVKSGDTIDSIATKFKGEKDKIIAFNDLPANGDLEAGKEIVIPDGQGEAPKPAPVTIPTGTSIIDKRQYANSAGGTPEVTGGVTPKGKAGAGHRFPYGYCTWYVAQKRYIPWAGNAGAWLYNARVAGYATGKTPRVGAIVVTTENRYYGHVALVTGVSGSTFTVSEMNYAGFAKRSTRVLSTNSRAIKGFIY